jgi:hypothetical protein
MCLAALAGVCQLERFLGGWQPTRFWMDAMPSLLPNRTVLLLGAARVARYAERAFHFPPRLVN